MVHFVLCNYSNCPKTNECYRFMALSENDQRYEKFDTLCNKDNNYHFLIKIRPEDQIIKLDSPAIKAEEIEDIELESTKEGEINAE